MSALPEVVTSAETVTAPEFSEDALALQFVSDNQSTLRFTNQLGKYFRWRSTATTGGVWEKDTVLKTFDGIRRLCREIAMLADSPSKQTKLCAASTVGSVESLVRCDQRTAMQVEQWDAGTMLLNTPSGIVDLESGKTRPADPLSYCTKVTACVPNDARPVIWEKCLATWTGGDKDLQDYLRRVCGYCLTGETREHQFFFLHGSGRNGKSVFLNTISGILNSYSRIAPAEVFTIPRGGDKHPTGCAGLVGCRLALATETEAGSKWAESQLKALVAGDRMATRYMRQDFFEFTPKFKLLISGNHRPSLTSVDEAIRARLNLLPFEVIIPPEQRDTMLASKLREEWPAILGWMIRGCMEWQRDGLNPPACVRAATDDYLQDQDVMGAWIEECCVIRPGLQSKSKSLYASWKSWCEENQQYATSQRTFLGALKERPKIRHEHTEYGNFFVGIGLCSDVGANQ